ncbi:uncharacterized protein NPIL_699671, partial [Nephila pilipes]
AVREVLVGKKYDHDKISEWINTLIMKILDQLSEFSVNKYIVLCNIESKCGAGTNVCTSTYWDEEVDGNGAGTVSDEYGFGMGGVVVQDLISKLPENKQYDLFFDNLFSSPALIDKLTEKKEGGN